MRFRSYDHLRTFIVVARHGGLSGAARKLNLTKGAIGHQVKRLEQELAFKVFDRVGGRYQLTAKGKELLQLAEHLVGQFETELDRIRRVNGAELTVGMSTYFASRWLAPRLMSFLQKYPEIRFKLQPTLGRVTPMEEGIDLLIRWGDGSWDDLVIEKLMNCPAFPTAGADIAKRVESEGLQCVLDSTTLLHDIEGSRAWSNWFAAAGYAYHEAAHTLVIPDPNVRVQAVINNQGLALYDQLAWPEIDSCQLVVVSPLRLEDYGYFLAYRHEQAGNPSIAAFREWILQEVSRPA